MAGSRLQRFDLAVHPDRDGGADSISAATQNSVNVGSSGPSLSRAQTAGLGSYRSGPIERLAQPAWFSLMTGVSFSRLRVKKAVQMRSPPHGEKWWGFRSDFAARFSPACLTGCGREMAQHSGIVRQGHTHRHVLTGSRSVLSTSTIHRQHPCITALRRAGPSHQRLSGQPQDLMSLGLHSPQPLH